MKMSVSLSVEDVEFLDVYATEHELRSRSAAVQSAVSALRLAELAGAYDEAWDEWDRGDDSALWAMTVADGI
jgi:Arc/MetJ-type ribon-helix-helix transcriptional regulator